MFLQSVFTVAGDTAVLDEPILRLVKLGLGLATLFMLGGRALSQPPEIPADHTELWSGGGYTDIRHPPNADAPVANNCTDCHGPYLGGGSAQSCFNCHWDHDNVRGGNARPSRWTIPNFDPIAASRDAAR